MDKPHKSIVEQKKSDTKEDLQFDSICNDVQKRAKLFYSAISQGSGSSRWGLGRGQEGVLLGFS